MNMSTTTKGYSCLASVTTRKAGKAMISMSEIYSIRQMRMEGRPIAHIAKKLEISRDTVYKYLEEELSPKPPVQRERGSILDAHRSTIVSWLEEDSRCWRKQRHTAKRIWERLVEEHGVDVKESTVRHYVGKLKKELGIGKERFLDLVWASGEAQADFGEADFYVFGVRRRLSYFVLTFPFSNVGIAQVFPGENAECVCQALRDIFEHPDPLRRAGGPRRLRRPRVEGGAAMAPKPKSDLATFRELARSMYFSNESCDWFCEEATAGQLRMACALIEHEQRVRERRKRERLFRKAAFP